ncbi:MAG: mechanosensitive ion channel domain-containing protein, partial [Spirochaetota bacterium]
MPFFVSGSTRISFVTLILTIPVLYAANWLGKHIRTFFEKSVLDRLSLDESKKFSISSLVRYGLMILFVIIGLSIIGIDLSSLAVIFGMLGIGLGFGLQNVISNFFAGIVIILSRPIIEGDRILVKQYEGTVVKIKLNSTIINTLTNETIIIPNSRIIGENVYNYSYQDKRIIISNRVQVSYSSNLDKVLGLLVDVGLRNPCTVKDTEPIARVESFGDSGIDM